MRSVVAVVALISCVHAGLWALLHRQQSVPNIDGPLASVSYSPYTRWQNPDHGDVPTPEQIRNDLRMLSPYTRTIRTYTSTRGLEVVPAIAAEFGMKVTLGIWLDPIVDKKTNKPIDKNIARNEREVQQAIALAKRYSNVNAVVVGNESILRDDLKVDDLIDIIKRVKRQVPVPVTTGETHDVWRGLYTPVAGDSEEDAKKKQRERADAASQLAANVDYIAAHILPYWDGRPVRQAVDFTITTYDELRRIYPGKRIVIAEFGWPSAGYNMHDADPGRMEQAMVIRDFIARAEAYGIDYNIIEAIDQPHKTNEGGVGAYWGLFDSSRDAKFAWTGPVSDPDYWKIAGISVLLGLLMSLTILAKPRATVGEAVLLGMATNTVAAWIAIMVAFWTGHYFVPGAAFAFGFGLMLLTPLALIALARIEEIATFAFGLKPRRLFSPPLVPAPESFTPKVSIHIPAYCEPPEMLKQTLDALARLDYPNFECVVVINNTPDPAFWQPIEEHCRTLGERFKFLNVNNLHGYKAGALRLALANTAGDAEIIGVIDADYVVRPDWLKDLVPAFTDAKVGMIQAPQDHRDGERSIMHHVMNGEYAGFFDIGMVQRNEANAIIVHGTMCLIRRAALEDAGGWSSDTIVEDSDLGLTVLEHGWQVHYTNKRYGHGLLPDTYEAFKKQRDRWAYGGLQIIRKHWRRFLPGARGLTRDQKREFALGWLNWLGAESIGVLVAILNLLWLPAILIFNISVPDKVLTVPIVVAFVVSLAHFATLYRLRVVIPTSQMIGAAFAAMSVQWTVARAVGLGLWKDSLPFKRTAKGGATGRGPDFAAFWEGILAAALLIGALLVVLTNYKEIRELNIFAGVLVIQSLPFLAAVIVATLEGTRFNEFAYWRGVEAKVASTLPQPALPQAAVAAETPAPLPTVLQTEKHAEPVQ
jgi:cellulose synthase/poly-beta-1,6-N-acetylglucosamine synthase-like glycosyltransferase/exo-beta-1,3-glucanase (GH17 family)